MKIYTVSFFGHRKLENLHIVEQRLETIVCDLLLNKEYVEFLVGRDGEFDLLIASVVKRCRRKMREDNSTLIWVLPYLTAKYRDHEADFRAYYDDVEISSNAAYVHYKAALQMRNREMVDRSNLVVFFVERKSGGAYQTLRYAEKRGVPYINISGETESHG